MSGEPAAPDREARALVRHLTGRAPSDYVVACYRRAVGAAAAEDDALDRLLLRAACAGRPLAALADAYGRLARPAGGFRRRVTLALAILENAPDTHRALEQPPPGAQWMGLARLAAALAGGGLILGAAIVAFGPAHLVLRAGARRVA